MITCHLNGGLGNQLFQIFTTISYAIMTKNKYFFLNLEKLQDDKNQTIRYTYWNTFFNNLQAFLIDKNPENINLIEVKESGFEYNLLPVYNKNTDILLHGYFQSYKYFQIYFQIICKIIGIERMKREILERFNDFIFFSLNSISLHFRIGDYKKLQKIYPILTYEYYESALKYIQEKNNVNNLNNSNNLNNLNNINIFHVFYFCEEKDINQVSIIIEKLKKNFKDFIFVRVENTLEDWEQMILMSC